MPHMETFNISFDTLMTRDQLDLLKVFVHHLLQELFFNHFIVNTIK